MDCATMDCNSIIPSATAAMMCKNDDDDDFVGTVWLGSLEVLSSCGWSVKKHSAVPTFGVCPTRTLEYGIEHFKYTHLYILRESLPTVLVVKQYIRYSGLLLAPQVL